jgi:hypothetical protein
MIPLRLAIPAVLAAAAVAGCIAYFVTPAPPEQVEADQPLPPTVPSMASRPDLGIAKDVQRPTTKERIDAFERAAEAILKNAKASAADAPLITGPIPLPKPRPPLAP